MPANCLVLADRVEIAVGVERGETDSRIALRVGRSRCAVSREINRNGGRSGYVVVDAQARADRCRRRPKVPKLVGDPGLAAEVASRLKDRDSPGRISIELGAVGVSICAETIYQALYRPDRGLAPGLYQYLHLKRRRRRCRRGYRPPGSHSLGVFCSIRDRPQVALDRAEVGHLEGDLIVGAFNRSALITLFDRLSRRLWLSAVKAKTADAVFDALIELFAKRIAPTAALTLAWDQGAEIARHREIAMECGIDIYIADPKSPWQRPTNEAGNALVRRYVGKGTDLNRFTPTQLHWIEHRINTIPRRSLGWATAHDTYTANVAMTD